MPTRADAEHATEVVDNFLTVPEDWFVNTSVDLPEPAVDGTEQWVVGEIQHKEYDKMVTLWLIESDVVQPYFDGYAHPREEEWGEAFMLEPDELTEWPLGE